MFILLGILMLIYVVSLFIQVYRKYILKIKEPSHQELWEKLEGTKWFQDLTENNRYKKFIYESKEQGLLVDSYYIEKLLKDEGTRDGFVKYMEKELKK